jgi:chaperonin GroEL
VPAALLVIAEDIDGEALAAIILNKLRGQLSVAAVKAPGFGDNRKSILGDIAILTGGTVFSDDLDVKLDKATINHFGQTGSVSITKDDTIILNGEGDKANITARCEQIRGVIADPTTSEYDRSKLQERLAKLGRCCRHQGRWLVRGRRRRTATTTPSTLPAPPLRRVSSPVVVPPSSRPRPSSTRSRSPTLTSSSVSPSSATPSAALSAPLSTTPARRVRLLLAVSSDEFVAADKFNWGYDAATSQYRDMISAGILDPLKVVRTALVDASGVASLLTTSEACVVDAEDKSAPGGMPGMGGMGGMGMPGMM